jgi:hypothetical protein
MGQSSSSPSEEYVDDNSNANNPNNDSYWQSRDYGERPEDVGDQYADYANAHNPNNDTYSDEVEHPNDYIRDEYGED